MSDSEREDRDEYNFVISYPMEQELEIRKIAKLKRQQTNKKWNKFIKKQGGGNLIIKKNSKLKKLVRSGIPNKHRRVLWQSLTSSKEHLEANKGYYSLLLERNKDGQSSATKQIDNDLRRTFPGHPYFDDKENLLKLRNVLCAYSWRNTKIGYCQSMNFIVGLLLILGFKEEEAFWMFVAIVEVIMPKTSYSRDLIDAHIDQKTLLSLMLKRINKIGKHIVKHEVSLQLITQQWFLCLYISCLPTEITLRILDVFFFEGNKILFRVALALFKLSQKEILEQNDPGLLFMKIKELPNNVVSADNLLKCAFALKAFSRKEINKQRKFWGPKVQDELNRLNKVRTRMKERKLLKLEEKKKKKKIKDREDRKKRRKQLLEKEGWNSSFDSTDFKKEKVNEEENEKEKEKGKEKGKEKENETEKENENEKEKEKENETENENEIEKNLKIEKKIK
ncbi:rab-gtpase-tbc domain-containing protein-related [Anaeramoeba flamelloides]|uniref:Rab-gtpase-tbc domain-containing protein-related n=1 Tax=Anaeramoeba flamelloides TaxID=1746091 RepID=A0AAV7Z3T5_9EUKA|nr:rab-gtpase-tbc domain-containing protein-related [Anaeramoeba flamelloides]